MLLNESLKGITLNAKKSEIFQGPTWNIKGLLEQHLLCYKPHLIVFIFFLFIKVITNSFILIPLLLQGYRYNAQNESLKNLLAKIRKF